MSSEVIPTKIFKNCQWILKSQNANKKKSPNYPCKRWGHTAVVHDKFMYVFSGCGKSEAPKQWEAIFRMDCTTYQWERLNSPSVEHPKSRDSHSCVALENKLYFFGGSCNEQIYGDLWTFDVKTLEWAQIQTVPELCSREGHSMIALTSRLIYIYGGWDSGQNIMQPSHWIYDAETSRFMEITNISGDDMTNLESHSANLIGEHVYIFGGQGQPIGKGAIFYRDLFKIEFENFKQIEEKFNLWQQLDNDDASKDSAIQIQPQETTIIIEKVKANGNQHPSPRASHSGVSYADRFLFIIGGEGYQSDQIKDNEIQEQLLLQEEQNQGGDDDDNKQIFPKNDIWIFETVMRVFIYNNLILFYLKKKTWSKLTPKSKQPQFQPRFSHSCVVYKDQLIIFGGLRSMGEVLEDIMVLHLKDSENHLQKFQRDEIKNVCKYCQLIYGIQVMEEDICVTKMIENHSVQQQKISLSFINGFCQMIKWPFSAIALLIDNIKLAQSKEMRIDYKYIDKKKIFQQSIQDAIVQEKIPIIQFHISEGFQFTNDEFQDLLFNFVAPQKTVCLVKEDKEFIMRNGQAAEDLYHYDESFYNKKLFGLNLKMAALRLGESALICHKNGNNYQVGLLSTNQLITSNQESMLINHYSINSSETRTDYQENREIILKSIAHILTEEDYIQSGNQNYFKIIIFDLQKFPVSKGHNYELDVKQDDIVNQSYQAYEIKSDKAFQMPDFSLRKYLNIYSLDTNNFKIFLQGTQVNLTFKDIQNNLSIKNDLVLQRIKDSSEKYAFGNLAVSSNFGILLYSQGRLINRYPIRFGQYARQYLSGYLNLKEFMAPNLILDDLQNPVLSITLYSTLGKLYDDGEEPVQRKEIKIN